jgi:hypothetical protein
MGISPYILGSFLKSCNREKIGRENRSEPFILMLIGGEGYITCCLF